MQQEEELMLSSLPYAINIVIPQIHTTGEQTTSVRYDDLLPRIPFIIRRLLSTNVAALFRSSTRSFVVSCLFTTTASLTSLSVVLVVWNDVVDCTATPRCWHTYSDTSRLHKATRPLRENIYIYTVANQLKLVQRGKRRKYPWLCVCSVKTISPLRA